MSIVKRLWRWLVDLMRKRRRIIGQFNSIPVSPPPPVDPDDVAIILLALGEL